VTPWVPPSTDPAATEEPGWRPPDAWFLAAVRVTGTQGEPAELADVIVAADALAGAIPSAAEVEHAVAWLHAAGLIVLDERGLAVTQRGRQVVARSRPSGEGSRMDALLELLSGIEVTPPPWQLDQAAYDAAILEHRHTVLDGYRRETRRLWRRGF
jgi:hypothetical protein